MRPQRSGQTRPESLSSLFGQTVHWIVRDVLGRTEVPAWDDPTRMTEWRGLFSAHASRSLIVTYWGGLRGDWLYACWLTGDTERTPAARYAHTFADRHVTLIL